MENKKQWYKSKTILASIVTVIVIIVGMFDQETSTKIAEEQTGIVDAVLAGVGLVSTAIAIYGRIAAKDEIGND